MRAHNRPFVVKWGIFAQFFQLQDTAMRFACDKVLNNEGMFAEVLQRDGNIVLFTACKELQTEVKK
jgi:hypothetical protein